MQPAAKEKPLRIKKVLNQRDVRWGAVVDLLCSRNRITAASADAIMSRFVKRLELLFNASWFVGRKLTPSETKLVLALCEVHGADSIVLTLERSISAGSIKLKYAQRVLAEPQLGRGRDTPAECSAEIDITLFGRTLRMLSLVQVVAAQIILLAVAVLTYVIFVGAFLKGFATFSLLILEPVDVTRAVTRRFDLLFGLLCFLVGTAGIFGQALRNLGRLALQRLGGSKRPRIAAATQQRLM